MKKRIITLFCLSFLMVFKGVAQELNSREWTLADALTQAMEKSPAILEKICEVEKQTATKVQVRANLLPHLTAYSTFSTRDRSLLDRSPAEMIVPATPQTSIAERFYEVGIEVRQLIFDGFGAWRGWKAAELQEEQQYFQLKETCLHVASQVCQEYDAILLHQTILSIKNKTIKVLSKYAEQASERQGTGYLSEYESLRIRAVLQHLQGECSRVNAELKDRKAAFACLLNLAESEEIRVKGSLQMQSPPVSLESALARNSHPHLLAARAEALSKKRSLQCASSHRFPKVEAFARYSGRSSYYDFDRGLSGWTLGVSARWPLFDGLRREGAIRAVKAECRAAELQRERIQKQLDAWIRKEYYAVEVLRGVIERESSVVALEQRSLAEMKRLYKDNQQPMERLMEAQLRLQQAKINLEKSIYALNVRVYQLNDAIGWEGSFSKSKM